MSYKHLFSRALAAAPGRLHFAAHSHHLWPDAAFDGHTQAWKDAAALADRKWDKVFGEVLPEAQRNIAEELRLPDPNTVSFAPNTHELLVRVFSARGRSLSVLTCDGEFHSFRRQSQRWEEADEMALRVLSIEPMESFAERLVETAHAMRPDVIFVSHVMFKSGLVFEALEELAALASANGTWVIVDGYHAFMAMPVDLSRVADRIFYIGGGYKYAMAGEGAAYLHAPPGFGPRPAITGWFAEFGALEAKPGAINYAPDGIRFMGATFDPTGLYRFNAARAMLRNEALDTGIITDRTALLRADLARRIGAGEAGKLASAHIIAPEGARVQQRFLALKHPDATRWKAALMDAEVVTDARDDVLRIGLGLYHDAEDVEAFCVRARETLGGV